MIYREDKSLSKSYKQAYLDGLNRYIADCEADGLQRRPLSDIFSAPEKHRADYLRMLGHPLDFRPAVPDPAIERCSVESDVIVSRVTFEILPGVPMTGLYFEHPDSEKRPFSIVSHGGLGTPELISGVYGFTANYNDILFRIYNQGINCFAPQLLLWDEKDYQVNFNRISVDGALKRLGSSVSAVEIQGIISAIDYFAKQPVTTSIGMAGLSYGGFYTLYTAAADTRICAALSSSFFSPRSIFLPADLTFPNAAYTYSDAEAAALIYPRKLILRTGNKDELFSAEAVVKEYERLRQSCPAEPADWLDFRVFEGTHEFVKDEESIRLFTDTLWRESV